MTEMYSDVTEITRDAMAFREKLQQAKRTLQPDAFWYPYDSLVNFYHLDRLLNGGNRSAFKDFRNLTIADIGAADGDTAFFFESLGNQVDIVDYAPTNFNGLRGAEQLKAHLRSAVGIHNVDLDAQFALPREHYDVAIFLGILYHLKNPFYMLEASRSAPTGAFCRPRWRSSRRRAGCTSRPNPSRTCSIRTKRTTIPRITGCSPSPACGGCWTARGGRCSNW